MAEGWIDRPGQATGRVSLSDVGLPPSRPPGSAGARASPVTFVGYLVFRGAEEGLIDGYRASNGLASKADVGQ